MYLYRWWKTFNAYLCRPETCWCPSQEALAVARGHRLQEEEEEEVLVLVQRLRLLAHAWWANGGR